jgi:hypothetical protein
MSTLSTTSRFPTFHYHNQALSDRLAISLHHWELTPSSRWQNAGAIYSYLVQAAKETLSRKFSFSVNHECQKSKTAIPFTSASSIVPFFDLNFEWRNTSRNVQQGPNADHLTNISPTQVQGLFSRSRLASSLLVVSRICGCLPA